MKNIMELIKKFYRKHQALILIIIIAVLIIAVGIYTIVKDNILLQGAGLIMMIYAVIEISILWLWYKYAGIIDKTIPTTINLK